MRRGKDESPSRVSDWGFQGCRRRPTLPRSLDRSTIGAVGLNDRVRNGNGCGPYALVASECATTESGSVRVLANRRSCRSCECSAVVFLPLSWRKGGVVKPHGRLGPLRSEPIAGRPRAAYRRSRLLRPLRGLMAPGSVHLGRRFPLRCVQRLSPPIIATRRCPWRDNRDTSGSSDSVLSY